MEEFSQQDIKMIEEQESSLLSYKLRKLTQNSLSTSSFTKTSENKSEQTNCLKSTASESLQISLFQQRESQPLSNNLSQILKKTTTGPTPRVKLDVPKPLYSSSASKKKADSRFKSKKKQDETSYKFLKIVSNNERKGVSIFQPKILSKLQVQGDGVIYTPNGCWMKGEWADGTPIGELKIGYPNQSVYEGQVYNFKPHGRGKLTNAEGYTYIGEFCDGQLHGEGIVYNRQNKVKKEGEWKRGKFVQ